MKKTLLLLATGLLMAACSNAGEAGKIVASPAPALTPTVPKLAGGIPTAPPGAGVISGGCGSAPVYRGTILAWASVNAPSFLPYVIATPDLAMGYLFSFPLRAGPDGNKILWYVRAPRDGQALAAEGHPVGASGPLARFGKPADSGPGEIYPTGVQVPTPGCWRFRLSWNGNSANIDLLFT